MNQEDEITNLQTAHYRYGSLKRTGICASILLLVAPIGLVALDGTPWLFVMPAVSLLFTIGNAVGEWRTESRLAGLGAEPDDAIVWRREALLESQIRAERRDRGDMADMMDGYYRPVF